MRKRGSLTYEILAFAVGVGALAIVASGCITLSDGQSSTEGSGSGSGGDGSGGGSGTIFGGGLLVDEVLPARIP